MKYIIKYVVPYILLIIVIAIARIFLLEFSEPIIALSFLAIIIYYFRLDNPHKAYLNLFSISLVLCFLAGISPILGGSPIILKVCIALSALIYLLRFLKREEKLWIDYLKVIIVLIGASLINIIPEALPPLSAVLGFTYILDRFIIRRQMKKTTQIIVFTFFALVCVTFVIYGQIKASEAVKCHEMAIEAQMEAEQVMNKARQQAEDAAAEAIRQSALVAQIQKELAQCKGE